MNNKKLNFFILLLICICCMITALTRFCVNSGRDRMRAAQSAVQTSSVSVSQGKEPPPPPEIGPGIAAGLASSESSVVSGSYDDFLSRFKKADAAIEKEKSTGTGQETITEKLNRESSKFKYWDTQLNSLYDAILQKLSSEGAAALAKEEQEWQKTRDGHAAAEASKSAGTADENLIYLQKKNEETRQRAYSLLERYKNSL
jgi:uncharacterized protein YecT (DUF1311 family)